MKNGITMPEEGHKCPHKDCNGLFEYPDVEDCLCHISPPCSLCIDNELECSVCGEDEL